MIAVLLPAAFHNVVQPTDNVGPLTNKEDHDILSISHGVCKSSSVYCPIELMAIYPGCRYLAFQSVRLSPLSMPKSHRHNYLHISSLYMLPLVSTRLTQELL